MKSTIGIAKEMVPNLRDQYLRRIESIHLALQIPSNYGALRKIAPYLEASDLVPVEQFEQRHYLAPQAGFSQHHTGLAIDIATPNHTALTEDFESTAAFRWLTSYAGQFGFIMPYTRDNPHGFIYEPWHWVLAR